MSTRLDTTEIAIRLLLTLIAGGLLGFNRVERDRPAGLRTTMLVCLTASVAMIQTNLLLNTIGKTPDSFVVMDMMLIPLGILSGMGFIGAGTILRRDNLVIGVTTAATLWFATVIGLCLGGGQTVLAITATVLGAAILWCLRWAEQRIRRHRQATLSFALEYDAIEKDIRSGIAATGSRITAQTVSYIYSPPRKKVSWEIEWVTPANNTDPPGFLRSIAARPEISELEWKETPVS